MEKQRKQAAKNEKALPITIEDTPSPQNQLASHYDRIADWMIAVKYWITRHTDYADDIRDSRAVALNISRYPAPCG